MNAVRVVAAGDSLISPSMTRRLIEEFAAKAKPFRPAKELAVLTGREREVLRLVASGQNNDEIAKALYMSPATARTHVSRIMTKLQARDRAQLVVLGYETGLVHRGGSPSLSFDLSLEVAPIASGANSRQSAVQQRQQCGTGHATEDTGQERLGA